MNKKFFGIKLSSIIAFVICLVASFVIWMLVKYHLSSETAFDFSKFALMSRG